MAQKVSVSVVCDMPHGNSEVEGQETIQFSFDGVAYEIDVCDKHAAELRAKFSPFEEHGHRVKSASLPRPGRRVSNRNSPRSGEIRSWAKKSGIEVSERGRIPASVVEQFERKDDIPQTNFTAPADPPAPRPRGRSRVTASV